MGSLKVPFPIVVAVALCAGIIVEPAVKSYFVTTVNVPAPISVPGNHALLIEETDDRGSWTPEQREIMLSNAPGSPRDFLTQHTTKEPNGQPGFILLDQQDDVKLMPPWVQEGLQKFKDHQPPAKLPWAIFSNGKTGYEGQVLDKVTFNKEAQRVFGGAK